MYAALKLYIGDLVDVAFIVGLKIGRFRQLPDFFEDALFFLLVALALGLRFHLSPGRQIYVPHSGHEKFRVLWWKSGKVDEAGLQHVLRQRRVVGVQLLQILLKIGSLEEIVGAIGFGQLAK